MDVCLVIKQRLEELGLEQRDLAAAEVPESYISQLLTRKKLPPRLREEPWFGLSPSGRPSSISRIPQRRPQYIALASLCSIELGVAPT